MSDKFFMDDKKIEAEGILERVQHILESESMQQMIKQASVENLAVLGFTMVALYFIHKCMSAKSEQTVRGTTMHRNARIHQENRAGFFVRGPNQTVDDVNMDSQATINQRIHQ